MYNPTAHYKKFDQASFSQPSSTDMSKYIFVRSPQFDTNKFAYMFSHIEKNEEKRVSYTEMILEDQKKQAEIIEKTCRRIEKLGYKLYHKSECNSRYYQNYKNGKTVRISDHFNSANFSGKNIVIGL